MKSKSPRKPRPISRRAAVTSRSARSKGTRTETSGGHIEVTDLGKPDGRNLRWAHRHQAISGTQGRNVGGHIETEAVDGDLSAETSGGHIEIRDAKGRVDADTSGGHVDVSFAKGNAHGGKIESSGGGISVAVDPNVDLAIDASTSGGSVRTDIPVKIVGKVNGSSIKGSLGKGGEMLYVHTSGGSVSISAVGGAI